MGIQITGSNDTIQAADGNLSIEGVSLNFNHENVTGISTMATGHITGTATIDDDLKVGISTLFVDVSAGRVGVGTDNPVGNLEVRDTKANLIVAKDGLTVISNSDLHTTYDLIQLGAGGALASYSTATSTADTQFIHNAYRHSGGTYKYRYADSAARIRMNSPQGAIIFDNAGSGSADGDITFTERLRITSAGGISISDDGSVHGVSKLTILPADRTSAFSASDGDTWHDVVLHQGGSATNNAVGLAFQLKNDGSYHKNAGTGIAAVKNGTNSDYGSDLVFITRGQSTPATEKLRITSVGALLVGTTSPTYGSGDMQHEIKKNNNRAYTAPLMTSHSHLLLNNSDTTDLAFCGLGFRAGSGDGSIGYIYRNSANNSDFVINTDGNANGSERLRVYNNGAVLIGAHANEAGGNARLSIDCEGLDIFDGVGDPANYGLIFANDPTSDKANGIGFFNDSASTCGGYIVHQDKGSGNIGDLVFGTSASSDTPVERMRIDSAGRMIIVRSGSGGELNSNDAALHVNAPTDGGQGGIYVHCNSQSGGTASPHYGIKIDAVNCANNANLQAGLLIDVDQQYTQSGTGVQSDVAGSYSTQTCYHAKLTKNLSAITSGYSYFSNIVTSGSGGNAYHMRCEDDGSLKLLIEKNGDVKNSNNSFSAISDVKLKENIVDASSQWDDIKAVKVRNFNFIADSNNTKMIGVVAQEIETVSAGLVDTDNDITVDDATGEGTITGTTKSVKYSILYMKAIKALQEAMARIETLETKVAALESA